MPHRLEELAPDLLKGLPPVSRAPRRGGSVMRIRRAGLFVTVLLLLAAGLTGLQALLGEARRYG
jgi:hypothetical protein